MQRFNYNDIVVKVDGVPFLCSEASATVSNSASPSLLAGYQSPLEYLSDSPLQGSISLSYYLTGSEFLEKYMIAGSGPFPVSIGGIGIVSGYLSNYSLDVTPHKHVLARADINFYQDFTGNIIPNRDAASTKSLLNYNDIEIIETGLNLSGNILSIRYNFSQSMEYDVIVGSSSISNVKFLEKESSLSLVSYQNNRDLPVEGRNVYISVKSKALEEDTENLIFNSALELVSATGILGFDTYGSVSYSTSEKKEGLQSVNLSTINSYISFYPSIPLGLNKEYSLSFYAKTSGATNSIGLFSNSVLTSFTAYGSWTRFSRTFTSDGISQIVKIINNSSTSIFVDSIQLEEKFGPTSFAKHSRSRTLLEINGIAVNKKMNHSFGSLSTSEYEIKQTGFGKKPVFGRFAGGLYGSETITGISAGNNLFIYGLNLASTSSVIFRQNEEVTDITVYDDRVISVKVPAFARSGRVKIVNSAGEAESFLAGIEKTITITALAI